MKITVRDWAAEYRRREWAIAKLEPGEKRPRYKGWNRRSLEPEDFRDDDNIGLQTGRLSGDLVCVDIDDMDVLAVSDDLLPPTGLIEGRPGKRRSHRWYKVVDIPPELEAAADVGVGGGPRTRLLHRSGEDRKVLIELRGTGSQAAAPPSLWTGADGRQERREWDSFEEPKVIGCRELYEAVERLAERFGYQPKSVAPRARKERPTALKEALAVPRLPRGERARQARAYLAKMPPAIQGQAGSLVTYTAACVLVLDFDLSPEGAYPILAEYNRRCEPPWSEDELWHKLYAADTQDREKRGRKFRHRKHTVEVNITDEDAAVYVGPGVLQRVPSYIELRPSFFAAIQWEGRHRRLVPKLSKLDWQDRHVILTPPSNIATSQREVWGEYFLAEQLRDAGARVESLRLPPLNGRIRTFAQADDCDSALIVPPETAWEAAAAAAEASARARDLDPYRRSLPRKRESPKLKKAMEFVKKYGIAASTKQAIARAERKGITPRTLDRALSRLRRANPTQTCN